MGCGGSKPKPRSSTQLRVSGPSQMRVNISSKDKEFKVVLLGNPSVGKTSLVNRYLRNTFDKDYQVTIGSTFQQKLVALASGDTVKLDIWDTGGQERFRALLPLYYRDASAALIIFDVTDPETFEQCKFWTGEVRREQQSCTIVLVGNKVDCEDNIKVTETIATRYAEENCMLYMQTSAKTGQGVETLFENVAAEIMKQGRA